MDYNLENKLRDKTDNWETHNLKNEIDHLKSKINDLESKDNYLQGKLNNHSRLIEDLINLLLYKEHKPEHENILHQLKQYLY